MKRVNWDLHSLKSGSHAFVFGWDINDLKNKYRTWFKGKKKMRRRIFYSLL